VAHVEDNSDYRQPKVATKGEEIVPESERRSEEHAESGEPADDATSESEGGR